MGTIQCNVPEIQDWLRFEKLVKSSSREVTIMTQLEDTVGNLSESTKITFGPATPKDP
jgi:hypothetical protein